MNSGNVSEVSTQRYQREQTVFAKNQRNSGPKEPKRAMGHEIPLASMTKNASPIELHLMNGSFVTGTMRGFDKWTISILLPGEAKPVTYFKHGILRFGAAH